MSCHVIAERSPPHRTRGVTTHTLGCRRLVASSTLCKSTRRLRRPVLGPSRKLRLTTRKVLASLPRLRPSQELSRNQLSPDDQLWAARVHRPGRAHRRSTSPSARQLVSSGSSTAPRPLSSRGRSVAVLNPRPRPRHNATTFASASVAYGQELQASFKEHDMTSTSTDKERDGHVS